MTSGISLIVYPVSDLSASRTLFTAFLGTEPYADAPYYVGYRPGTGPEVGLDPNAGPGQGPICYSDVADIEAALEKLIAAGATAERPVSDVGGGLLIATVRDPDGSIVGLRQPPA
jgi:catechol 2,3-dioxygenase-like lactoylglutathione lyase family enzyme